LITGTALVVGPYVAGVIVAAESNLEEDKRLNIPIAGPWLDLGQRPCSFGTGCSTSDNVAGVLLIASGVAQGAGLVMAVASAFVPETHRESVSMAKAKPQKPSVHVTPVSYYGGGGIGAIGRF
jgi:hypothetical protein